MSRIYDALGVRTIINAKGTATRLSGGPMRAEVSAAMVEAAGACVDMAELQAAASRVIADATGAEAGLVTSGAAAGLLLGAAACMTGLDPAAMGRLPDTTGLRNEVIIVRSQRNGYDHAVRAAGARLVEVGIPDRFSGAGVRDAEAWEIEAALGERTAAVLWVADVRAEPPLAEVVRAAHTRGVPLLVDAAAQLPPAANLRHFTAVGADLVAFSGGKALGGPQASGILCGRRDLVMAAALQMLDMDALREQFRPPARFIDVGLLPGLPQHGIGRSCKVGKEQIVGLLTALRLFIADDAGARRDGWLQRARRIGAGLAAVPGLAVETRDKGEIPELEVGVTPAAGIGARALAIALELQEPSIRLDWGEIADGLLLLSPICLGEADELPIVDGFRRALAARR